MKPTKSQILNILINVAISAFSILMCSIFIEGGFRIYENVNPPIKFVSRKDFRASRPKPYENADYFCDEFLSESNKCIIGASNPDGTIYLVPKDFSGEYINIVGQKRLTTDHPEDWKARVLLFGGSTIFNISVPDQYTIASCLQRMLNSEFPSTYLVENYGFPSMNAAQQTDRLIQVEVGSGDIVIFYDGCNEVFYSIYNGNKRGWLPGDDRFGGARKMNKIKSWMHSIYLKYNEHSATVRILFDVYSHEPPANITDKEKLINNVKNAKDRYCNALMKANNYVVERNGKFYHLLQPVVFTLKKPTEYERWISENQLLIMPGLDIAFDIGYPKLKEGLEDAKLNGLNSHDLSGIYDGRNTNDEEYYLDFCHVNHVATQIIAQKIYDVILAGEEHTLERQ